MKCQFGGGREGQVCCDKCATEHAEENWGDYITSDIGNLISCSVPVCLPLSDQICRS